MASIKKKHGVIGILTGGGDVPGLNPAIRAVTIRAIREGFKVIGLRNGWKGLISMTRDRRDTDEGYYQVLTEETVNKVRPDRGDVPAYLPHSPEPCSQERCARIT